MSQFKGHGQKGFHLPWRRSAFFVLFRPSKDWMKPTHIWESLLTQMLIPTQITLTETPRIIPNLIPGHPVTQTSCTHSGPLHVIISLPAQWQLSRECFLLAGKCPSCSHRGSDPEETALIHLDGLPSTSPPGWPAIHFPTWLARHPLPHLAGPPSASPPGWPMSSCPWKLRMSAPFHLGTEAGRRWNRLIGVTVCVTAPVSEALHIFAYIWFVSLFFPQHISSMREDWHPFSFSFLFFNLF